MRIVSIVVLIATFLGVSVNAGWCPEPADLGAPIGASTGATAQDVYTAPGPKTYKPGQEPWDPRNMTRSQRLQLVGREKQAGRITNAQELKNFLQTGDPQLSWTPPPPKPLPPKPASMSDAQWQRIVASRPKPPDYVRGTYDAPYGAQFSMEQNATRNGGTLTGTPSATTILPPANSTSKPASTENYKPVTKLGVHRTQTEDYKPVTKLGVHPTQAQPGARVSPSAADRLVSSHRETGGTKTTLRSNFTAPAKTLSAAPGPTALDRMTGVTSSGVGSTKTNGHVNAPPLARYSITPPVQRSQDTFRQPK